MDFGRLAVGCYGVQRGNRNSAGLCLLAFCSAICKPSTAGLVETGSAGGRENLGAWVGLLGEALEQCFNAQKIVVSGRDGEQG